MATDSVHQPLQATLLGNYWGRRIFEVKLFSSSLPISVDEPYGKDKNTTQNESTYFHFTK